MAEGDCTFYNNFKEQLLLKIADLDTDTLKVTLHTGYTPNIDTHDEWNDVSATEYGSGSGYTAGGATLTNVVVSQDDTNDFGKLAADDVTWTSLGPLSPATPSHAILRDTSVGANGGLLICYWELGTTATTGADYTLKFGTDGVFYIN